MKRVLPLIVVCLILILASCARKKSLSQANSPNSSSADKSLSPALDPAQARVYLEQGKESYKKDEDQQAVEAFQKAINLDPSLAEAYFRLGLAHDALGEKHEAEEAYKKAIDAYRKIITASQTPKPITIWADSCRSSSLRRGCQRVQAGHAAQV